MEYFERVALAIDWDDKKKAKLFPAFLPNKSEGLRIYNSLSDADKKSFKKIKEGIQESEKPKRNLMVQKLLNAKRNQNEELSHLADRIIDMTNKVYCNAKINIRRLLARDIFINSLNSPLKIKALAIPELPETIDEILNLISPMDL
ncbi:hypothetical protein BLA29_006833, partial [Euroglyphus maynei]